MTKETRNDTASIETQQGCCGTETTDESSEIEANQGCCGSDTANSQSMSTNNPTDIETQQGCCGSEPTPSQSEIETDQGCCGTESTKQETSGCGESSTSPSCCGESDEEVEPATTADTPKSAIERERIRRSAETTDSLITEMADAWTPEWTERDVYEFLHDRVREKGLDTAWSGEYCPAVHAGAGADIGHSQPEDRVVPPGELLHVDFGVSRDGYAADLQRVYYYPEAPNGRIPDELQRAFEDVHSALEAGLDALEPGVNGHEVDAAARGELTNRGWSEFNHAFGHQVGRDAHDDGTLLGPLRERYSDRSRGEVREREVYSVELGVGTIYGYVGLEEMVEVTGDGYEYIISPQTVLERLDSSLDG